MVTTFGVSNFPGVALLWFNITFYGFFETLNMQPSVVDESVGIVLMSSSKHCWANWSKVAP